MESNERKGYQWPASALTKHEMAILANLREQTKTPICELLRQCVEKIGVIYAPKG